ncbi:MAG: hypothetical protein JW954_01840 [Dehalococcoidaceae bacterium]|nr:hypothetical protein [Dehalococcoidaceae bacterium]
MFERFGSTGFSKIISLAVLLVFIAAFLPACGSGDTNPTTPATPSAQASTTPVTTSTPAQPTTAHTSTPTTTPVPPTTISEDGVVTGTLSPENLKVSGAGVAIEVSPVCLNEEAEITITPRQDLPLLGEIAVTGYDFDIDTTEDLAGVMTLTIPYDKTKISAGMDTLESVGAAYFNESTGLWESVNYDIDETNGTVIITTDHLSVYGAFVVGREYTRAAYVEYTMPKVAIRAAGASSAYANVISEAIDQNMVPGPSALELGNGIVSEWLGISGAGLTALSTTIYSTEFLNGISGAMTNLGLLSAIAQAAVDYQSGNNVAMHTNLIKNLSYYAVSKFGSAILQLGSVGVFAIDYALSKFANEAISGRKDIYQEAYRLYYLKAAKRTSKDWYYILLPMARESKTPAELNSKIMAEIDRYCAEFWQDELEVAFYQDQAQKNGFTGGGGLNQSIKTELSNNHKFELLQGTLQPVFNNIARKMAVEQETLVRKELDAIAKQLNRIVTIQVFDSAYDEADPKPDKARFAGFTARIAPLADEVTDKEKWQAEIDGQGKASLPFRVLGHIMAGSPNKIQIVSNDGADEIVKEVEFMVTPPTIQVDITDGPIFGSLVYTSGTSNSASGDGVRAAVASAGTITIDKEGTFSVEVPYATTTRKEGTINWVIETTNFIMEGNWDNDSKTGSVDISCIVDANGIARDSFTDDPGMEKHYVRTEWDYFYTMTGSGALKMDGGQIVMTVKFVYSRNGNSTMGIYNYYNDEWHAPENPIITDLSGSFSATWIYRFNVE